MKARPRSIERKVAEALNAHFAPLGLAPVERIPVLGRTGPDISLNALQLVIDVKSRLEVPKAIFFPLMGPFFFDGMIAVRLANLPTLWDEEWSPAILDYSSKTIRDYLAHMEEWTRVKCPDGISCVILHRPEMPIGASVAVIYQNSRRRLIEYAKHCTANPRE